MNKLLCVFVLALGLVFVSGCIGFFDGTDIRGEGPDPVGVQTMQAGQDHISATVEPVAE